MHEVGLVLINIFKYIINYNSVLNIVLHYKDIMVDHIHKCGDVYWTQKVHLPLCLII
jgi:hypothetical protein